MDERIQLDSEFGRVRGTLADDTLRSPGGHPAGSESAFASITLGAVFAVAAAPTTSLVFALWMSHFHGFGRLPFIAAAVVGFIGGLFVLACIGVGLFFGIAGTRLARRQGRPIALGIAGCLLNFLDFWAWIGILICWAIAIAS